MKGSKICIEQLVICKPHEVTQLLLTPITKVESFCAYYKNYKYILAPKHQRKLPINEDFRIAIWNTNGILQRQSEIQIFFEINKTDSCLMLNI